MSKISFDNIKIGDKILTTSNRVGYVIAIKSYAYLNNKIAKKSLSAEDAKNMPFKFDGTRHNGVWYAAITAAVEDTSKDVPTYYIENLDFIEIQKIITDNKSKKSIFDIFKKIFKK